MIVQITMSQKELSRVSVLENAFKNLISNPTGAKTIGVSVRQFRRIKRKYKDKGAQGRVERVNETLQDRLVKELRLLGINNITEGNSYLPRYMEIFNAKFAVTPASEIKAHRPLLQEHNLEEILCLKSTRVLSKNLTAQYENTTYQIQIEPKFEYILRRAKIEVIEKLDGQISLNYKNKPLPYPIIQERPKVVVCDSKSINQMVEFVKEKQGRYYQFNLWGRIFLLCVDNSS